MSDRFLQAGRCWRVLEGHTAAVCGLGGGGQFSYIICICLDSVQCSEYYYSAPSASKVMVSGARGRCISNLLVWPRCKHSCLGHVNV